MFSLYTVSDEERHNRDSRIEHLISELSKSKLYAMSELYELIKTDVYAYALSKISNEADAEDITHDTFVKIWKNACHYTPMGKPLAWIFTIEINLIRRYFSLNKRILSLDESIVKETTDNLEAQLIDKEFIREIFSVLCEEEREIISLHIISGMKHREIAGLLNKPLSTVLSKYNRAIKKLKANIEEKEER